jgi:transposase
MLHMLASLHALFCPSPRRRCNHYLVFYAWVQRVSWQALSWKVPDAFVLPGGGSATAGSSGNGVSRARQRLPLLPRRDPCGHARGMIPASAHSGPQMNALAVDLSVFQLLPVARVSQVLSDLFATTFSQASVRDACQKRAQRVAPVLEQITTALQNSRVVHNEDTGFRVLTHRWWLHVACTQWDTLSLAHPTRGDEARTAMEIVPHSQGTRVHDSLAMSVASPCSHALCVAHALRERTVASEHFQHTWAAQITLLLRTMHLQVEHARGNGMNHLSHHDQQDSRRRSRHVVDIGLAANPPPTERTGTRGALKKSDGLPLVLRVQKHEDLIVRFLTDVEVPFPNNQADNDLRMMTLRQKRSGCFRILEGSALFCALRRSLSTMQKQGAHLLTALASTCSPPLLSPPLLEAE